MNRPAVWLASLGLVIVLGTANYMIWQRQQVVDNGQPVLLQLQPVDPRSMMQGDYMVLRYADTVFPPRGERPGMHDRGTFIVRLDENNVAEFSRIDDGGPLGNDEARLKYKQVDLSGSIRLGAESFFFQEGQAQVFNSARYGVLHVDDTGTSVLVGLADENGQLVHAPDDEESE